MNTRTLKNVNKYVFFFFVGFFFLFITYLSIPLLYKVEKIRPVLEKQLLDNFDLNIKLDKKIEYLFLPSPRFKIKNVKFINSINKDKILSDKNEISIKINLFNPFIKNNLIIDSVIIHNSIFNLKLSDLEYFKNSFLKKIKKRKIYINLSQFFLIGDENKIISMINVEKGKLYFNKNLNKLIFNSNIFNTNFNGILSQNFSEESSFINQLFFPDIGLSLKSVSNKNNSNILNGNTVIKIPKSKFQFEHFLSSDKLIISNSKLENNYARGSINVNIIFDPFYFSIEGDLNKFNFIDFFSSNIFEKNDYMTFFNLNEKINGNIKVNINNFDNKLIKSGNIDLEFKNSQIIIDSMDLQIENNDYFHLDGLISNLRNKNFLTFNSSINIEDTKKIFIQIPIPKNKKVKKVKLSSIGHYDFETNKLKLNSINNNGKTLSSDLTAQINNDFNSFFKGKKFLDLFNKIKFRKFINKLVDRT